MVRSLLAVVCFTLAGAPSATAHCLPLLLRTPPVELRVFAADPAHLLKYANNDKTKLEDKVTEYLATDPDLLPQIAKLISLAPGSNRSAIGRGLARAAQHCGPIEPKVVQSIIDFVRRSQDSSVSAGYASIESDAPVPISAPSKPVAQSNSLFEGEWNMDVGNPFAPVPLPLELPR
ncbi:MULTISPECIES: hypothetical protein [Bradyrhizobium]|uniref:hypothetical protein n=1 Tax=Bradyrhizobium TaxID=374 RepID=UPI001B89F3B1|nr:MULTISPECIES: hypothetical protein [Bradyrhizobium]MBR0969963.1 hypothetical protein [Bradyrhizobium japonicum]